MFWKLRCSRAPRLVDALVIGRRRGDARSAGASAAHQDPLLRNSRVRRNEVERAVNSGDKRLVPQTLVLVRSDDRQTRGPVGKLEQREEGVISLGLRRKVVAVDQLDRARQAACPRRRARTEAAQSCQPLTAII